MSTGEAPQPLQQDTRPRVAVIMACHNRCASTLRAIAAVLADQDRARITVYAVDDGSVDETASALAGIPEVRLLHGDGSLFWARSMALAEASAVQAGTDYILWLNNDTFVSEKAIDTMLKISAGHPDAVIVGATGDPETGEPTYGARRRVSAWHPQRLRLLDVSDRLQSADTFNGNLVLIPIEVQKRVGGIDGAYPHAYADDDYGLRATRMGVPILQAPGILARCAREATYESSGGSWKELQSPKGLPWRAQVRFLRRHGPWWWPFLLVGQYSIRLAGRKRSPASSSGAIRMPHVGRHRS